jgi:hypothetical protein
VGERDEMLLALDGFQPCPEQVQLDRPLVLWPYLYTFDCESLLEIFYSSFIDLSACST